MKNNLFLFNLSWKYIHRHKGRSFFIIFSVVISVFISIFILAFFNGIFHQIEKSVVDTNTGLFQLQEKNYAESQDSQSPEVLSRALKERLKSPLVKGMSPELVMEGNISQPEGSASLIIIGIDPELNRSIIPLDQNIKSGNYLVKGDGGIFIGSELAEYLKFKPGDNFLLNYQDINGELKSENLPVTGIYNFNSKAFEKKHAYINQATWQRLYLNKIHSEDLFHRIILNADGLHLHKEMASLFGNFPLKLKTWKDINPEMSVVLDFNGGMIKFFLIIIAITVTLTILNPVRMLWEERLKEFKMLTILGISRNTFWRLGFIEACLMMTISLMLSSFLLVTIISIQSRTGIDFSFLNNGETIERAGIALPNIIHPRLSWAHSIYTIAFVTLTLGFGYCWSIWSTLRKLKGPA